MFDTVSPVELIWTVPALLGVLVIVGGVLRVIGDWRFARRANVAPETLLIAGQRVRHQTSRMGQLVACLTIGVVSLLVPADPEPVTARLFGAIVIGGLFLIEGILVVDTLLDYVDWRRLLGRRK